MSCSLDAAGLARQRERYREIGRGATVIERSPTLLRVELDAATDPDLIEATLATERECCPFFTLERAERTLTIAVAEQLHGPALDAIAFALGLPA